MLDTLGVSFVEQSASVSNSSPSAVGSVVGTSEARQSPFVIAVRELCEFAAKSGDLDLRFTPSPTAQEGMAGHKTVASRRGESHRAEVWLTGHHDNLLVQGRADGFDERERLLEEVKTFRGDLTKMPANKRGLHWAQAKVYAWLACQTFELPKLRVRLVYLDIASGHETIFEETLEAKELQQEFQSLCSRFTAWAQQELAHRANRDLALTNLTFLHSEFRTGQRTLAESTFKAIKHGRCLMAQADTGIGKTVGTLFPALKAMPAEGLDKVFFLTAKSSGQLAPLQAVPDLLASAPDARLRTLQLVARDQVCERPDKACHGESCDLAKGFYDRLPGARQKVIDTGSFERVQVRAIALEHAICPYFLSQELVRWADVVVADYNYYFGSSALLFALTATNDWRVTVLVDEAHNLVERGRSMYTADLSRGSMRAAAAVAPSTLAKPMGKLARAWSQVTKPQAEAYAVADAVPPKLTAALTELVEFIGDELAERPDSLEGPVLDLYFDALRFTRLAESFGAHSLFDISVSTDRRESRLCIRNIVPAPFLAPRFSASRASVLFSATLSPPRYYTDTLGLPADAAWLATEAPFSSSQLRIHVVDSISTRYSDRQRSLAPIARLIEDQLASVPGNYIAFFSSFEYLEHVADELAITCPRLNAWRQTRRMSPESREEFLARFVPGHCGVGFAVLGGSFSEGVDLPGERLVGAFVATLGLPQLNSVNEQMRRRLQSAFGAGYDYAYLFPGIRKVVQAAGRVVRTPTDVGTVYLIDDRFNRPEVRRLLPAWWSVPGRCAGFDCQ